SPRWDRRRRSTRRRASRSSRGRSCGRRAGGARSATPTSASTSNPSGAVTSRRGSSPNCSSTRCGAPSAPCADRMAVAPRVTLVTLSVGDVDRAESFYRALGWEVVISADDGFRLFRTAGAYLTLWPAESLWADAGFGPPVEPRFGGVVLAMNLDSPADVDEALATAATAGGPVLEAGGAPGGGVGRPHPPAPPRG